LHEFEALIFSRLEDLTSEFPGLKDVSERLTKLIASVKGLAPEDINETVEGAPSKRLMANLPYKKRRMGPKIAGQIGLERLRTSCPHFGKWLTRLENLGGTP
jgi:hypothetical protein